MKEMYDFGVYIRNKYKTLNKTYDRTQAWAISTDHDRNIQSTNLVLTGIFNPTKDTVWIKDANITGYYPIPIHTSPVELDRVIFSNLKIFFLKLNW